MGMAMMDFLVREARQVVSGKMAIIRFGSCGGLREEHDAGTVVIASKGSVSIVRNPNAFGPSANVICAPFSFRTPFVW
jgi:uridine phosphorylase